MLVYISSGNGTSEVCRALWHFYTYLSKHYNFERIHIEEGACKNCFKSILLKSDDENIFSLEGSHLWKSISPFRPKHKRKNWFFSLALYDESASHSLDKNKIIYQSMKSPKNGGQHVNATCSGIRVVYPPLNLEAISYDERSQFQNKKIAYLRLLHKVQVHEDKQTTSSRMSRWKEGKELKRGEPVKIFSGSSFKEEIK